MSFRRPSSSRAQKITGRRFIICCEGEGEEGYLDQVRMGLRLSADRVIITAKCGTDPLSIVIMADSLRTEQRREGRWKEDDKAKGKDKAEGDAAWTVFDGDEHIQRDKENWDQAIDYAQRKAVKVVISNPSLELWYLLHFQDKRQTSTGIT